MVALVIGFTWAEVFSHASYAKHHLHLSVIGLAPSFFGRLVPIAIFVVLGALIAPSPKWRTIATLGLLGGVFGWPFGPVYEISTYGPTFYLVEVAGAIAGSGLGMLIAFALARRTPIVLSR